MTANDCKRASSGKPTQCALAKATKREYDADGVIVGMTSSYIIKGKKAVRFKTPPSVQRELTSFDRHHDFAPGDYILSPVNPSAVYDPEKRKKHSTSGSRNDRRVVHKVTARVRDLD